MRRWLGSPPRAIGALPEEAIRVVRERARELKAGSFETELKKYRVDYVIIEIADPDFGRFDRLSFLEKVRDEAGFRIFRVNPVRTGAATG